MRRKIACITAGMMAVLLHSCSEDIQVAAPYKDITVGYGLLNMADTAHYIRIQKAFLDEQKSAVDMSKTADSSFYAELDVRVREINGSGTVIDDISLSRVDLTAEGYPKQPGSFFTAPNYAYKFKKALDPANRYRLVIRNTRTGDVDSAETAVISSNPDASLGDFTVFEFRSLDFKVVFENQGRPYGRFSLSLVTPANGRLYEGIIRFNWIDRNIATNQDTRRSADWHFALTESSAAGVNLTVDHSGFYSFLADAMKEPGANIERYMDSCDLIVWAATEDVYNYRRYELASGGLTGDQVRPQYTNFKGDDILGLFASRAVQTRYRVPIAPASLDSLMVHPTTRSLKIRGLADR
jgi:hypothetical protein